MSNTYDLANVIRVPLVAAIERSISHNEIAKLTLEADIATVAGIAGERTDNVDYVRENDGSYDMWGWSDEMEAAGKGEMEWRLNVTVNDGH